MKTGETYTLYTDGTITGITELNSRISKGGTISDGNSVLEYTQSDVTYSGIKGGFGPGGNGRPNERPSMPSMSDGERPKNLTITVHVLKPPVRLPEFHKNKTSVHVKPDRGLFYIIFPFVFQVTLLPMLPVYVLHHP